MGGIGRIAVDQQGSHGRCFAEHRAAPFDEFLALPVVEYGVQVGWQFGLGGFEDAGGEKFQLGAAGEVG